MHRGPTCWCGMPTEGRSPSIEWADPTQRMTTSFEAMNMRIARLAIGLKVSLHTEADILRVMHRSINSPVSDERRQQGDRRGRERSGSQAGDRRVAHLWTELRGLLVLRYQFEATCVQDVGPEATRHMLLDAEAHLLKDGFKPGADGLDLSQLIDGH